MLLCLSQQVLLLPSAFLSIHLLSMRETELADESRRVEIFSWYEAMSLHSLPYALLIFNIEGKNQNRGRDMEWLQNQGYSK